MDHVLPIVNTSRAPIQTPTQHITTLQERTEYEDAIQVIEAHHRHDLAVHLYSTFLLHQINPHFPPPNWASWPMVPAHALDPRMATDGEDFVVSDSEYRESDLGFLRRAARKRKYATKYPKIALLPGMGRTLPFFHKPGPISSPRATLVNEMHFLIQRKVKEAVKRKNAKNGDVSVALDCPLIAEMATRLANRLGNVMDRFREQKRRNSAKAVNLESSANPQSLRNWQDVLLAAITHDKVDASVDIRAYRKLYTKMKSHFVAAEYPYEYDPEMYVDPETGHSGHVPEFTVEGNLEAIESEGLVSGEFVRAQDIIAQREEDQLYKERVFFGLVDQAAREKQLSYEKEDEGAYVPTGDFLKDNREWVFKSVSLAAKDFQARVKETP